MGTALRLLHLYVIRTLFEFSVLSFDQRTNNNQQEFTLKFNEYTEVAGYAKVRLWMSCEQRDDMDVVIQLRKIDSCGQLLEGVNFPCPVPESEVPTAETSKFFGPQGFLRSFFLRVA